MHNVNERLMPNSRVEGRFRREVRDILDLDIFTRDDAILAELCRLKKLEALEILEASCRKKDS